MVHNPGRYTLSQTEFVLAFKKGKFPQPRGARNIRQMVAIHRAEHSVKPVEIIDGITKMFPQQDKIELFARNNYVCWDNWGLEIPDSKIKIETGLTTKSTKNFREGVISFVSLRFCFPVISSIGHCRNFQYLQGFVGSAHTRPLE